jgi:hypothetical protein
MSIHVDDPAAVTAAQRQTWMLPSWPWMVRAFGVVCLLAAEATNTAQLADRFPHWFVLGIIYVVIAATEGLLSAALILRPSPWAYRVAIGVGVLTISLWWVGLPFGPDVGRPDAMRGVGYESTAFQAVSASAFMVLAGRPKLMAAAATGRGRGGTAVAVFLLVTTVGALAMLAYTVSFADR